jgi:nucleotide-binding universal stress UspA family protein
MDLLQTVLAGIGRPMLIAAPDCHESLIRTVVIAWKDTAEAARAVGAAMPFIARAERVLVMTAGEAASEADTTHHAAQASARRLVATLQRHAPLVHAQHVPFGSGSAAQALLAAAAEMQASLLVMGGYGHGELRERIFGGFTRTVLGGADLPVLMMR